MKKAILTLLFVLAASVAEGATYWVRPTGTMSGCTPSDTEPTQNSGFAPTIAAGAACMSGGDTLNIKTGTYTEGMGTLSGDGSYWKNGTATMSTKYRAVDGPNTVVLMVPATGGTCFSTGVCRGIAMHGNRYIEIDGLVIDGSNQTVEKTECPLTPTGPNGVAAIVAESLNADGSLTNPDDYSHHITIKNGTIRYWPGYAWTQRPPNTYATCPGCGGNHQILNNHIHHVALNTYASASGGNGTALHIDTQNTIIDGNTIHDVDHVMVMQFWAGGPQSRFSNNAMYNIGTVSGCAVGGAVTLFGQDPSFNKDTLIYNNTLSAPGGGVGFSLRQNWTNARVLNNTIYEIGPSYSYLVPTAIAVTDSTFANSIIQNNFVIQSTGNVITNAGVNTSFGQNFCLVAGTGCQFTGNPQFVAPTDTPPDFHLQSTSGAINNGASFSSLFSIDIAGVSRPQGLEWDIGAYEYVATTLTASLKVRANGPSVPVVLYAMDANSGTFVQDTSGKGNHATFTGTGTTWAAGKYGASSLSFNGNGGLTIPDSDSLDVSVLTIETWIYSTVNDAGTFRAIYATDPYNGQYMYFFAYSQPYFCPATGPVFGFFDDTLQTNVWVCDTSLLTLNTWVHLAATFDGQVVRLYRDGTLVGSTASTWLPLENSAQRYVARSFFGENYRGRLDDFRIYNYAKTQVQIQADMAAGLIPPAILVKWGADANIRWGADASIRYGASP